jgi:hypothetical protein
MLNFNALIKEQTKFKNRKFKIKLLKCLIVDSRTENHSINNRQIASINIQTK